MLFNSSAVEVTEHIQQYSSAGRLTIVYRAGIMLRRKNFLSVKMFYQN